MDVPLPAGKVAIPRLERSCYDRPSKPRVPVACLRCRKRKVRCSGVQPSCQNCVQQDFECLYPEGRKDRLKSVEEQSHSLIELLKDLSVHVDEKWQQRIGEALEGISDNGPTANASESSKTIATSLDPSDEELTVASLDEDLFTDPISMSIGFIGQNSEIQWLRQLQADADEKGALGPVPSRSKAKARSPKPPGTESSQPKPKPPVANFTFYLYGEDHDIEVVVSPNELPDPVRAQQLMLLYRKTIHPSFPILPDNFEEQYWKELQPRMMDAPYQETGDWRGLMNAVFAIGAHHLQLTNVEWSAGPSEHAIYARRAMMALNIHTLVPALSSPSLSLIQATALLSFYHLTLGYVSRAWMMIGISVRFAVALGLHLRNDSAIVPRARKAFLSRTWSTLSHLESLISSLNGRDSIITPDQRTGAVSDMAACDLESCSVHHPQVKEDVSSEICSSYLSASVAIDVIEHEVIARLYSSRQPLPPENLRKITTALLRDLDDWASAVQLPPIRQFDWTQSGLPRGQSLLIFKYLRVKILICRPCLSEFQVQKDDDGSLPSFISKIRRLCVETARALADHLPDGSNVAIIYQRCPFWCAVHHVVQALAVLLIELSRREKVAGETSPNVRSVKKLCRVLRAMSVSSFVARRAYGVIISLLQEGTPQLRRFAAEIMADEGASQADPLVADTRTLQVPLPQPQPILNPAETAAFTFGADLLETLDQYQQPLYPGPGPHQWPADYTYLGGNTHMDD